MSTRAKAPPEKPKVGLPAIIISVVIALVIVVGIAYKALGPGFFGPPPPKTIPVTADSQWIIDKAQATNGDYNKLSPDDQKKLQQITRGMGPMALAGAYKSHPK